MSMITGGFGAFKARREDIIEKYYTYEGESLEDFEKKVGQGFKQIKMFFFSMVMLPFIFVALMELLKFIMSMFSNVTKDAENFKM